MLLTVSRMYDSDCENIERALNKIMIDIEKVSHAANKNPISFPPLQQIKQVQTKNALYWY